MIYLDNNATTPVDSAVSDKMCQFLKKNFGNPSSLYPLGKQVHKIITEARENVAEALGAERNEIFFTGSGTESDNFALKGVLDAQPDKNELITSSIEHPAIMNTAGYLEKRGIKVSYVPVDEYGTIDVDFLEESITSNTALISIMLANNEIGTIQPLKKVIKIAKEKEIPVHTDAVQAFGKMDLDVNDLGVDLLSVSAHKIYGPKGIGALYIRKGSPILPFIYGGHQENGMRAGTENTAGIMGFSEAVRLLREKEDKEKRRIEKLAEELKKGVEEKVKNIRFNGHPKNRIKGTLNFSFFGLEAEAILLALATKEIYVSTGSACSEGEEDVSHVLKAIGLKPEVARSSVRMSLGRFNTKEDVQTVLEVLPEMIDNLREISEEEG